LTSVNCMTYVGILTVCLMWKLRLVFELNPRQRSLSKASSRVLGWYGRLRSFHILP
jgi:hypothetical protein